MKLNFNLTRWTRSTITALAVAGSAGLCQAAAPIVYNFASDLQGWAGAEATGKEATYAWNATGGSTGGGCMQVVIDGTNAVEMDPRVTLAAPLNERQYLSVSIHMKVDPNSGTTGTMGSGGYGNLQAVFRDASYSWDSIWYGTVFPPAANSWVTYTFVIGQPYKSAEQYLQFQFQGNSSGYSGPLTNYIDNVTITPIPNPWVLDAFTSDTSTSYSEESWTGTSATVSLNTTDDAGGGFTPTGCLQIDNNFTNSGANNSWQQSWIIHQQAMDPSRYSSFELDVKVDTANSTPFVNGTYGSLHIGVRNGSWGGPYDCVAPINLDSSYSTWKHLKLAIAGDPSLTNSVGFDIELVGVAAGPVRLLVDNLKVSKPVVAPRIYALQPGTPGGVKVYADADGTANPWDEEAFASPAADNTAMNFFWINRTPASYSFTLTNCPTASVAPGYQTHIYLVNGDSLTAAGQNYAWNTTYSGAPYNAYDYAGLWIQNTTNNTGLNAIFEWKTNQPAFDATNKTTINLSHYATANGTWTLNFSDNTHATLLGPDGNPAGTITLPDFYSDPNYTGNFNPGTSCVQFGIGKNDNQTNGINNNQSVTFTHVLVSNAVAGVIYDDSFTGPGLTAKYAWQVAEYYQYGANRVSWQPYGTAYWLEWGDPATGYSVLSSTGVTGPWTDAGVTYTYTDSTGTNHFGAIPAASLPVGNAGFFRLANPNP
jgi:hypothetical protein